MKVGIISANLGGYDQPAPWPELLVPAGVELEVIRLDDASFQPRPLAMTSRLQCGIPKWFGTDFAPMADVIIWIDASCAPTPSAVAWFLERLKGAQIAVFAHPERRTLEEEYNFVAERMQRDGETYLNSRYKGEDMGGMFRRLWMAECLALPLYASTAFAYRTTPDVVSALQEVFLWKARHFLHDQLAFPWVLHKAGLRPNVIPDNYLRCEALTFVRKGKRR